MSLASEFRHAHRFVPIMSQVGRCELNVAILNADNFDHWLEGIGVSVETFSQELIGTWQFNYIQALQCVGIRSVLFFTSNKVDRPTRVIHKPTGTKICLLPSSKAYKLVMRWRHELIQTTVTGIGTIYAKRVGLWALGLVATHFSTPLVLLRRELFLESCQCILVEQYEDPRFDLAVLLGRLIRIPVFGTFTAVVPSQNWWRRPFRFCALRLCAGLAICAGGEAKRVIDRYKFKKSKIRRIYYPVDLSVWYPSNRQEMRASLGVPADAKIVIYHGSIDLWTKGLDVLIDAWGHLCAEHPAQDLRLILIGTGSDAQELERLLAVRRLRGVEWLNQWVHDRNVLRRYLSAADVYVFPSRIDAFGIAVIEAMACGLPIVAASAPGILDILADGEDSGGLVVPTGDAGALAGAIERVLNDSKLALDLAKSARRRVESTFSMEGVGHQLCHFLTGNQ